jgi:hypothetical protein
MMEERILSSAWRLWRALEDIGRLNLWEARAILGETREFTCDVLLLLASQGRIRYYPVNGQLFISPAEPLRPVPVGAGSEGPAG